VQRIRFIKQGQKLGFSLDELVELLSLEDGQHCREARDVALKKLDSIRERIQGLRAMESALSALVDSCLQVEGATHCPMILALMNTPKP
jgi:MerR family mercuric resistance operon transcriptional regulator